MTIEQEIHQHKFKNDFEKLAVNVLYTGSWLHHLNTKRLKAFGLTPEQYNVLRILRGYHPQPMMLSEIACRMIDRSSNATRLVEKLRVKKLIKREICGHNRRQVDISITGKGLQVLGEVDVESERWESRLKSLSKAEARTLNVLLDKLRGSPSSD
jgi:DNA-binding MarR family transcriptional regulator